MSVLNFSSLAGLEVAEKFGVGWGSMVVGSKWSLVTLGFENTFLAKIFDLVRAILKQRKSLQGLS